MYLKIPSQSSGYDKLLKLSSLVSAGKSLLGKITVLGTGTPIFVAKQLLKNFSSALHQKGLFITVVPHKTAA